MKILRGRKALVTGAASGIGRALALALAREGVDLFLLDLNAAALDAVVAEAKALGVAAVGRACDVTDPVQIDSAVAELFQVWGTVHILVNNAGIVYYGNTRDMSAAQLDRVMSVNLLAPMRLTLALLPTLCQHAEAHVLNVSSIFGLVPKRRIAAYQASKFGLVGFSQSLRSEHSPYGLGVTALCPGIVQTGLLDTAEKVGMLTKKPKFKNSWLLSPEYVAERGVRGIRRNQAIVVVPFLARVFWWLHRLSAGVLDLHGHLVHARVRRRKLRREARAAESMPGTPALHGSFSEPSRRH